MIVASALDSNGAALTFGLVTAVAVVCLIVVTAVGGAPAAGKPTVDEAGAMRVEELVQKLVGAGADEATVRRLVREASQLHVTDR